MIGQGCKNNWQEEHRGLSSNFLIRPSILKIFIKSLIMIRYSSGIFPGVGNQANKVPALMDFTFRCGRQVNK